MDRTRCDAGFASGASAFRSVAGTAATLVLLESGLRDPVLVWGYSAMNEFLTARNLQTFAFTPEEQARAGFAR